MYETFRDADMYETFRDADMYEMLNDAQLHTTVNVRLTLPELLERFHVTHIQNNT